HPAHRRAPAAARRTHRGPGAGDRPAHRRSAGDAQAARHDHPAGGAEFPLRQQGCRPLLRGRPRQDHRQFRRCGTARPHEPAQRSPGGLMTTIFDIPIQAFLGQLLIGLINGSFYALLSLGLAIIFGMLKIINFAHGAQYMIGAFAGYLLLATFRISSWPALSLAPLIVGLASAVVERVALSRLYDLDHLSSQRFTCGLALALEGALRCVYRSSGQPDAVPKELAGGYNLGFMVLAKDRAWVVLASLVVCLGSWLLI